MFQRFQKQSFWKVLESGYRIVIPAIQRDYAQGRADEKVKAIRDLFLDALISAVTNGKPLVLDFVYGIEETDSAAVKCWVPIDGQQRLTTLYLLHTYVLAMTQENNPKARELLGGFRYAARESTQDFCAAWIKGAAAAIQAATDGSLYDAICNQTWFARSWLHDPTIASMLMMLDSIHKHKERLQDACEIWGLLTQGKAIEFMFLDLNEAGIQADELYIRMNARGRLLQPFEHFKAFLLDKCVPKNDKDSWGKLLDGDWSELFWKHRNAFQENKNSSAQDNDYDNEWTQAFRGFALISAGLNSRDEKEITHLNDSTEYIAFNTYKQLLGPEFLDEIKAWLNAWHKLDEEIKSSAANSDWAFDNSGGVFESFLSQRPGLKTIARFYAASLFLAANNTPLSAPAFRSWMRVVRNWTEAIDFSAKEFGNVLQQIKALAAAGCNDVYGYLTEAGMPDSPTLAKEQMAEERLKARLIVDGRAAGEDREAVINQLELSPYLEGNITSLLSEDWDKLKARAKVFPKIFGSVDDSLIIRTLLSQAEYWMDRGSYCDFGGGKFWLPLLTSRNKDVSVRIKAALTDILSRCESIEANELPTKMEALCQAYVSDAQTIKDWRFYLVKYPEMTRRLQDDSRIYYWHCNDFEIRRHNKETYTLNAYHFNPYAVAAMTEAGLGSAPAGWGNSTTWYDDDAPIRFQGVEIWPKLDGWQIFLPDNAKTLFETVKSLGRFEQGEKEGEWLLRTISEKSDNTRPCDSSEDRIEAIIPLLKTLAALPPVATNDPL